MTNERLACACVTYACEDMKIPVVPVIFVNPKIFPNDTITAMFLPEKDIILFNQTWVSSALPEEIALTAFHEARHVYQRHQIKQINLSQPVEDLELVRIWKREMEVYHSPNENQSELANYLSQSIERDAIQYAKSKLSFE